MTEAVDVSRWRLGSNLGPHDRAITIVGVLVFALFVALKVF